MFHRLCFPRVFSRCATRASHCVAALESGATAPFSAMQLRRLRRQQAGRPMLASNEKRLELDRHVTCGIHGDTRPGKHTKKIKKTIENCLL